MADNTETPAALMRRAAQLMRERAQGQAKTPWLTVLPEGPGGLAKVVTSAVPEWRVAWTPVNVADHVASWHPLVALAVADLLERDAAIADAQVFPRSDPAMERYSLAVARAYLGEPEATHG